MEMIANLPLELRVEIFKRFVDLRALSKDMKTELLKKWFRLFYDKTWRLIKDRQYDQSTDIVHFLQNTVNENNDIKLAQLSELENGIEVIIHMLLYVIDMGRLFEDFRKN